jgi:hypothetical protein
MARQMKHVDETAAPCEPIDVAEVIRKIPQFAATLNSLLDDALIERDPLADILDVSPRTLTRWTAQADGIPSIRLGTKRLYRVGSVKRWLAGRETSCRRRA